MADFSGGQITSDAGALLLREADRDLGLLDALDEAIEDTRDQRYTTHEQRSLLAQRIIGIDLGYEDLNDHDQMRKDPALKMASERRPEAEDLSSASTLCRLENRAGRQSLWRMSEVLVDAFIGRHSIPPRRIVLDVDATDDEMHGEQQLGLFADRTSCTDFLANQFRLLLASAAYVLIEHMRSEFLAGTELEHAQVRTIRLRLLKIGALVKESVRRVAFHMASGYPLKELFALVLSRMRTRPEGRPLLATG